MRNLIIIFVLLTASCATHSVQSVQQNDSYGNIDYIALVLDSVSSARLVQFAEAEMPWTDSRMYCHHMTIAHHTNMTPSILRWTYRHLGETHTIRATHYGHSDKAFAVKVKPNDVKSVNKLTHVTMATHPSAKGSAVDSNYILDWTLLPASMDLTGTITIIYKK